MNKTCGSCTHYLGGGDWNLCCDQMYELCYKDTPACDKYNPLYDATLVCPECGYPASFHETDIGYCLNWRCDNCGAEVIKFRGHLDE